MNIKPLIPIIFIVFVSFLFIILSPSVSALTKEYNFSDETNIWAYEHGFSNGLDNLPPTDGNGISTETSWSDITSDSDLDADDGSGELASNPGIGKYNAHLFFADIQEEVDDITLLNWSHNTDGIGSTNNNVYLYNSSSNSWYNTDSGDGANKWLYGNISGNVSDFINSSGYSHFLVQAINTANNEYVSTDYISLEITYDGLQINTPSDNDEVLNTKQDILNISTDGYNNTAWYSFNDGKSNITLCTGDVSCAENQTTITYPKQGYFNLTVWANKSDGTETSQIVENVFVGNRTRFNITQDTYIWSNGQTKNYGNSTVLASDNSYKFLISENLTSLGTNKVTEAKINLYKHNPPDYSLNIKVYDILHNWNEGNGNGDVNNGSINGTTYLERWYGDNSNDGNTPFVETDPDWQDSGLGSSTDYNSSEVTRSLMNGIVKWEEFDLINSSNLNGTNGWIFVWGGVTQNTLSFRSSNYTDDISLTPYLNITYFTPNTPPSTPTLNSPSDLSSQTYNNSIFFNWSAIDSDDDNMTFYIFSGVQADPENLIFNLTNATSGTNYTYNFTNSTGFADGTYYWKVLAQDTENPENVTSSIYSFQISTVSPSISLNSPTSAQWFNNGTNIYFNYTATDGDGLSTCYLYGNWTGSWAINYTWTQPESGVMNYTNQNISSDNRYKWAIWCNDSLDSGGFSVNSTFGLDTTNPDANISSVSTTAGSQTFTFSPSISDSLSGLSTCKYTIFNSTNQVDGSNSNITFSCDSSSVSATATAFALYNISLLITDTAGNSNTSNRLEFETETTPVTPPSSGGGSITIISGVEVTPATNYSILTRNRQNILDVSLAKDSVRPRTKSFYVINRGKEPITVEISCDTELNLTFQSNETTKDVNICDYVNIINKTLVVSPNEGELAEGTFEILTPEDSEWGDKYFFNIIALNKQTDKATYSKLSVKARVSFLATFIKWSYLPSLSQQAIGDDSEIKRIAYPITPIAAIISFIVFIISLFIFRRFKLYLSGFFVSMLLLVSIFIILLLFL